MNEKIEKLKSMLGKSFKYNGVTITLLTYMMENEKVKVITDGEHIETNVFELEMELVKMEEVLTPVSKQFAPVSTKVVGITNPTIEKVQDKLLEMLEAVSVDESKANQANSVVNIAEAIIKTEKVKIEQVTALAQLQQKSL